MNIARGVVVGLCWLLLSGSIPVSAQALPEGADLRLLVDVSGSMQNTDPDKLREPALELLARLMPEGVRAGIWAFGGEVEALVPHQVVDSDWKKQARETIAGLESRALFTHIGAALEKAGYDRAESDSERDAHILLLTDGMVDVSPDADVNAREQKRILEQLVPELAAAGYRIHTVGLSERADSELLRQIAQSADGLFIEARSPDQLMDSLLGVFQQSVPTNALPIQEEGRFLVDESVREFTALIMRPQGAPAAELVNPAGDRYQRGSDRPGLNWHHTRDYDLITQTDPAPGHWRLEADLTQASRVSIISNMQLQVKPLATNPLVGQEQRLDFWLQNDEGRITDPDLLSLLEIEVRLKGPGQDFPKQLRWSADAPPEDGRYRMRLPALKEAGDYRLSLELNGKTFQRRFDHRMKLDSLFSVELEELEAEGSYRYQIQVRARQPLDSDATSLVAHLQNSSGFSRIRPLEQTGERQWSVTLSPEREARYRVGLEARGRTRDGVEFQEQLPSQYFTHPPEGLEITDPLDEALRQMDETLESRRQALKEAKEGDNSPSPEPDVALGSEPEPEAVPQTAPKTASESKPESGWHPALVMGNVVLVNLVLLGLAYWGYRKIMGLGDSAPVNGANEQQQGEAAASEPPPMQDIEPDLKTEPEPESAQRDARPPPSGEETSRDELNESDLSDGEEDLFSLEDDEDGDEDDSSEFEQAQTDHSNRKDQDLNKPGGDPDKR